MLTTFLLIQLGINLVVILCLARLLRERVATARQARQREERLEALAAEICAVGRELARRDQCVVPVRPAVPDAPGPAAPRSQREERSNDGAEGHEPREVADRFLGAARLLERGATVEQVSAQTALLPGEVQILGALRRAPGPTAGGRRNRPSSSAAPKGSGPARVRRGGRESRPTPVAVQPMDAAR